MSAENHDKEEEKEEIVAGTSKRDIQRIDPPEDDNRTNHNAEAPTTETPQSTSQEGPDDNNNDNDSEDGTWRKWRGLIGLIVVLLLVILVLLSVTLTLILGDDDKSGTAQSLTSTSTTAAPSTTVLPNSTASTTVPSLPSVSPTSPPSMEYSDPFIDGSEAHKWQVDNGQSGLRLEVLNGLTDDWQGIFDEVLSDWENGEPDALDLSVQLDEIDQTCEPVRSKLKVCNGDYGDTGWRGINEVLISGDGFIISSIAKMNDYYLKGSSDVLRRYTMCHQMGHGFGLSHTDEDFFNEDLGNCMDYTNNPEVNMRPDETNYELLTEWYGQIDDNNGATRKLLTTAQHTQDAAADVVVEVVDDEVWDGVILKAVNYLDHALHLSETLPQDYPARNEKWEMANRQSYCCHGKDLVYVLPGDYKMEVHVLLS
jgi:hypothetical protein